LNAVDLLAAEMIQTIDGLPARNTASIRAVRRRYSRQLRSAGAVTVIELALQLLHKQRPELRFVAYELIQNHPAAVRRLDGGLLRQLGGELGSWDAVDSFACILSGRVWQAHQIPDELIHDWARSPDRWWRRAALVSTVPLNMKSQGGAGDAPRTLAVCGLLIDDRDDMVVKAMSWALRALATRDPQAVREFVADYEARMAPRVLREVHNKLSTGLKNPRRSQ
jgi:3-methyladenine DNA glycosylase AlkD